MRNSGHALSEYFGLLERLRTTPLSEFFGPLVSSSGHTPSVPLSADRHLSSHRYAEHALTSLLLAGAAAHRRRRRLVAAALVFVLLFDPALRDRRALGRVLRRRHFRTRVSPSRRSSREALRRQHPQATRFRHRFPTADLADRAGSSGSTIRAPSVLLAAGLPCQPFAPGGSKLAEHDERADGATSDVPDAVASLGERYMSVDVEKH